MALTLEELTKEMTERVGEDSGFGYVVKFDFGNGAFIHIDAKNVPNKVTNDDLSADSIVTIKLADFEKISDGSKSPTAAFMAGRMKVKGNVAAAWKLGSIIGPQRAKK